MKKLVSMAAAIVVPMTIGTAVADDPSVLPAPMSDQELSQVTGGYYGYGYYGYGDYCFYCSNSAYVYQANVSYLSAFVYQSNYSDIDQDIN